jgi:tRNA threonylcarbamoyladenosine biosynthesis protein TsaB
VNTLQMMAAGAITGGTELLCPMIDARRMEVFTALYDQSLNELIAPQNRILSEGDLNDWLEQPVIFFGNGSDKFRELVFHSNAIFKQIEITAEQMTVLSYQRFEQQAFADLAYSEPLYGKEFYSPAYRKS